MLTYDDPDYTNSESLEAELRRVADVCHQCRRCLPLCPSFPKLFDLVDASPDEVAGLSRGDLDAVNELCFHCKLCYNHCPYTPPHEWDIDFPALMRRQQIARAERDGVSLARRLTTKTDWIGRIGALTAPLMNFMNRNRPSRVMLEKTLGIHRDWVQPRYYAETLTRWFRRRGPRGNGRNGEVALFATCSVNYSDTDAGRAAVRVLEHSGVKVEVVYGGCCGMPSTDTGDLEAARKSARRTIALLKPFVDRGAVVAVPGPSCSLLMKTEYPSLVPGEDSERLAAAVVDLMEHVYDLAKAKKLERDFKHPLGKVAYHAPCHLRAQNIGFRSADLLRLAGAEITLVDACSGVDGTWGMQARFHEESMKVARKMLGALDAASADEIATDCPLSALRIEEGLGRKAHHPIVLFERAYGLEE